MDSKLAIRFGTGKYCNVPQRDNKQGVSGTHFTITLNDNHECPLSITDRSTYGSSVTPHSDENDSSDEIPLSKGQSRALMSGDFIGYTNYPKAFQIQIIPQERESYRKHLEEIRKRREEQLPALDMSLKDDPLTIRPVPTLTKDPNRQRVFDGQGNPLQINPKGVYPEVAHENIVPINLRLQATDNEPHWLGEWTDEEQALARQKELPPEIMLNFAQQILGAAAYLHEGNQIAHGDIQSSNIFVSKDVTSRCKLGLLAPVQKCATIDQDRRDIGKVLLEFSLLSPWIEVTGKPQMIRPHSIWESLAKLGNAMSHPDHTKRPSATAGLEKIQNLAKEPQSEIPAFQQCKDNLQQLQDPKIGPILLPRKITDMLHLMSIHDVKDKIIMTMSKKAANSVDGIVKSYVENLNGKVVQGSIDVEELRKTLKKTPGMLAQTGEAYLKDLLEYVFRGHLGKKSDIKLSKKRERDEEDGMGNGAAKKCRREG